MMNVWPVSLDGVLQRRAILRVQHQLPFSSMAARTSVKRRIVLRDKATRRFTRAPECVIRSVSAISSSRPGLRWALRCKAIAIEPGNADARPTRACGRICESADRRRESLLRLDGYPLALSARVVSSRVKGKGHTLASATIATKRQHATARDVDDDGLGRAALQQSRTSWCGPSAKPLGRCLSPGRYR